MEEILKRLRQVRGYLGLKQGEFSKRLKMPQNSYSQIETGVNPIKDRHIALICFTFDINEIWLRTGQGQMFNNSPNLPPSTTAPIIIDGRELPADESELIKVYRELIPDNKKLIRDSARIALVAQENAKNVGHKKAPAMAEKGDGQKEEPKRG
jgi:transcriptional regulator with XRE-family HTH domain